MTVGDSCWTLFKIGLEGFDVVFECCQAGGCYATGGLRLLSFEAFLDGYVAGGGELVDLDTQVAGCRTCRLPKVDEVRLFEIDKYRHHCKTQFGM